MLEVGAFWPPVSLRSPTDAFSGTGRSEVLAPLRDFAQYLATGFAHIAGSGVGLFAIASAIVASLVLASFCGSWALVERYRTAVRIERMWKALRHTQTTLHFRNALIHSLPEAVVVMPTRNRKMLTFQDGKNLLEHCLAGPDAARLAAAIDRLLTRGEIFALEARTIAMRRIAVRGRPVGDSATLFLRAEGPALVQLVGPGKARPPESATAPAKLALAVTNKMARHDFDRARIVFDAQGRLKQYNQALASHWSLTEDDLRGEPHLRELAATCVARTGRDAIWDIIESALASTEPERHGDWGVQAGADGRRVRLAFSRQQDGETTVVFSEGTRQPVAATA